MSIVYCDGHGDSFDLDWVRCEVIRKKGTVNERYYCENCFCELIARIQDGTETESYQLNTVGNGWASLKELIDLEML